MPTLIRIQPGGATEREENKVGTEKFLYILDGNIETLIGEEKFLLAKGDTLYFNASIPHILTNLGSSEAQCISILTPPTP